MSELRDRCKLQHSKIDPDIYKEIFRLNSIIDSLKKYIVDNKLEIPEIKNTQPSEVKKVEEPTEAP